MWKYSNIETRTQVRGASDRPAKLGQRIVFGEWLAARHSKSYSYLPDVFLIFDIFDSSFHGGRGGFVSANVRDEMLRYVLLYLWLCLEIVLRISIEWRNVGEYFSRMSIESKKKCTHSFNNNFTHSRSIEIHFHTHTHTHTHTQTSTWKRWIG